MQEGKSGLLTADSIVATRRRRVETSMGGVLVRALGLSHLGRLVGQLLDVSSLGEAARALTGGDLAGEGIRELVSNPKIAEVFPLIEKVVAAGCVEPKFGDDPAAGPVVADLPLEDQFRLFNEILQLSGYSKEAGESIRPS
jgi:hypothetical protein